MTFIATRKLSKKQQDQLFKNFEPEITAHFTADEIEQLARETQFVQRENAVKLNGSTFLALIVFNSDSLKKQSLNDLTIDLEYDYGIKITNQSLNERFNEFSILFLENVLATLLQKQLAIDRLSIDGKYFKRILIKDSISFQIDASLKELYSGSGGSGSDAAIRIQFEYDLLGGKITDLSMHAFTDQDANNSIATIERTCVGDLVIRDLGYMNLEVLRNLISRSVTFICRVKPSTKIYELQQGKLNEVNFVELKQYMQKHQMVSVEKDVYLSRQDPVHVRLIINLLPDDAVNSRIRKANKNNKKKGLGPCTREYRARAMFNLHITNSTPAEVPMEKVYLFYKLRWQIELIFKIWKSLCALDKVKKVKRYRLECYLYSRLIFIVLAWQIIWSTAKLLFKFNKKPMSYFKIYKTLLRKMIKRMQDIFFTKSTNVKKFIFDLYTLSKTKHFLEKKKGKLDSWEITITCLIY